MTKQFFIYGHVQGVGFRYFTWKEAEKLGVKGWVRNRADGSVEVVAQGDEKQLADFANWFEKGPRTAKVAQVVTNEHREIAAENFTVRRD